MKKYFSLHLGAVIVSVIVGLIYMSHHFFIPLMINADQGTYYPITERLYLDEATFYGPRANAAYFGQWVIGDINTAEHRGGPAAMSLLNPLVMGNLGKALGSLKNGIIVSDIIFPIVIFLLVYAIALEFTGRRLPSLVFASVFIFAPKFGMYIPPLSSVHIHELIAMALPFLSPDQPLYFSQFEEPKLTFPFFALAFLLCFRAFKNPSRKKNILAGISFGLLFYTYFYDWTSFLISMVFLVSILFMNFGDRKRVCSVASVIGVGALVSSYYWINFLRILMVSHAKEITDRAGKEISHSLRIATVWKSYVRNLALIGLLISCAKKRKRILPDFAIFLTAFLLNYFVTVNVQIITGFNLQPDHWYRTQFFIVALAVFLLALWFYDFYLRRYVGRMARISAVAGIIYILAGNAYAQVLHSKMKGLLYTLPAERIESYAWLNAHTENYSVVGALSFSTDAELQLHTHNKIFVPNGLNTLSQDDEIWSRFFYINNLFGITQKQFNDSLHNGGVAYYLFSEAFGDHGFDSTFSGTYKRVFPEAMMVEKTKEYTEYRMHPPVKNLYRLDYIYTDARDSGLPVDMRAFAKRLKKIYENGSVRIYQFMN